MTKKPNRRDSAYYKKRLEKDFPDIYKRLQSGEFKSLSEATVVAGLRNKRTRLHELKNAWRKATEHERREFIEWAYDIDLPLAVKSIPEHLVLPGPVASGRRLEKWAIERIEEILKRRAMQHGEFMDELGFDRRDVSVRYAIHFGYRLQPKLIAAITIWLAANASI